jgi:hypothetical protein
VEREGVGVVVAPLSAREYRRALRAWDEVSEAVEHFKNSPDTSGLYELEEMRDALAAAIAEYEDNAHGLLGRLRWRWWRWRFRRRHQTVPLGKVLTDYGVEAEASPTPLRSRVARSNS